MRILVRARWWQWESWSEPDNGNYFDDDSDNVHDKVINLNLIILIIKKLSSSSRYQSPDSWHALPSTDSSERSHRPYRRSQGRMSWWRWYSWWWNRIQWQRHRGTEQRSSQRSTRALNRVNSSLGITPAWISTNQRIGDDHIHYQDHINKDGDNEEMKKLGIFNQHNWIWFCTTDV